MTVDIETALKSEKKKSCQDLLGEIPATTEKQRTATRQRRAGNIFAAQFQLDWMAKRSVSSSLFDPAREEEVKERRGTVKDISSEDVYKLKSVISWSC